MSFGLKKALIIFLCLFVVQTANASISDGLHWLTTHNNPDGSYATGNDIATSVQTTSEALQAFSIAKLAPAESTAGYAFLSSESFYSTEYLSRKIIALVESGDDASSLLSELEGLQQLDGSFSELPGFDATVLDTAFAAEAFSVAGRISSYQAKFAINYLFNQQNTDGGWGQSARGPNSESSVYVTSLVLTAIAPYRALYNLETNISNAQSYLLERKQGDALWGETFVSAQALIALVSSLDQLSPVADSLSRLRESQLSDGSWDSDVYTTALSLRALQLAASPPNAPALASIIGTVVDADTQLPLEGISLALSGTESQSRSTDADGGFSFINLAAGAYSLEIRHADYATVTTSTTLSAGQLLDFGTIHMVKQAHVTTGAIRGTITDTNTGSVLEGVTITVSGVSGSVLTDSNGDFQIADVQPGSVSVEATISGYSTATGVVNLVAGSIHIFSPALTPVAAPVTELRGTVTDGSTGQPLVNVSVSVTGATTATATTDAHGYYQITGLNPGNIVIELSATGYDSVVANATVYENNIHKFSPALYPTGTTSPGVNTAGVNGIVVDSATGQPLGNVYVTATFGAQSQAITTNSDGRFEFTGIVETQGLLRFSLNGYQYSTVVLTPTPMVNLNIGQIGLRQEQVIGFFPDLIVESMDASGATADMDTLEFTGSVLALIANRGTALAPQGITVLAFYDNNKNGAYDAEVDILLGNAATQTELSVGANEAVEIPVSGVLPYRDAHIKVWVDSIQSVIESNEQNNIGHVADACQWPSGNLILNLEFEGNFYDSTEFNNHAAVDSRSQGIAQTVADGVVGEALSLQDGLVWLRVPDSASLRTTEAITMSAWVSPTGQIGSNSGVYFKGELIGQQPDWQLNLNDVGTGGLPGSSGVSTTINGTGYSTSEAMVVDFDFLNPIPMGVWTHVAVTYDRNELRLYINGSLVGIEPWSNPINSSGSDLYIGNRFQASGDVGGFQGLMDELRLYNVALSPDEISRLASRTNADLTASQLSFFTRGDGSNQLTALIGNAGSVTTASGTQISFYEGDPNAGGTLLGSVDLPPLPGDSSQPVTLEDIIRLKGKLPLYVVADSTNMVSECNEANNVAWMAAPDLRPDLIVESVDTTTTQFDMQTLELSGKVNVVIGNQGNASSSGGFELYAFFDANRSNVYEAGIDHLLGQYEHPSLLNDGGSTDVTIDVSGTVPFRDAPVTVWVDSGGVVVESNEQNNTGLSNQTCFVQPEIGTLQPIVKWAWHNSSSTAGSYQNSVYGPAMVGQLTDDNGDGLINSEDTPDVVFMSIWSTKVLNVISGSNGQEIWSLTGDFAAYGSVALGDIDADGVVEIVASNANRTKLMAYEHTGELKWSMPHGPLFRGSESINRDGIAIADMDGDGAPEIITGRRVYSNEGVLLWEGSGDYGGTINYGVNSLVADVNLDGKPEVVAGRTLYNSSGSTLWHASAYTDGFNAIGNFDDDDFAEIVLVAGGRVYLLEHTGSIKWGPVSIPGGGSGGAPTVADMDGDGLPEIGVAGARRYMVLEHDGSIKWTQTTTDASSHRTGSSVFDFEGDGKAEVVYADERHIFIYDGTTGAILEQIPNGSYTTLEYPVIADIDNDGHAELLVGVSYGAASSRGLIAYESVDDNWVATRNIWNQHTYHITNINDDGTIPAVEEPSWLSHNTYRLNTFVDRDPRGTADLTATAIHVIDNGSGKPVSLRVRIGNGGLSSSLANVKVSFYAGDPATGGALLGTTAMAQLSPYGYRDIQLDGITLPAGATEIYAFVDSDEQILECNEVNNITSTIVPLSILGEITVATDAAIYGPNQVVALQSVITNTGALSGQFLAELRVEDAQGTLIQRYTPGTVGPLAGGTAINLNDVWNTSSYQSGAYRLHGLLTGPDGVLIDEAQSPFEIRHSVDNLPLAALRTTTDQPVYHTSDTAQLNNLARNLSNNTQIRGAVLRIRVTNEAGDELFTHQQTLNELFSGTFRDANTPYGFENAAEGIYTVTGELTDASGNLLATDQAQFAVQADLQKDLTGKVTAQLKTVLIGQTQTCTDTLTHAGSQILDPQPLRQILANLDSAESVTQSDLSITLQPGATESRIRSVETGNLSVGEYACVLQAMIAGEWITLDYDNFSLMLPPIEIQGTLEQAALPRLLVLLDENNSCVEDDDGDKHNHDRCDHDKCDHDKNDHDKNENDKNDHDKNENDKNDHDKNDHDCCDNNSDRDPDGPSNAPSLSEQRSYLEALLTAQGYSYTIVSDSAAFNEGLLSGAYDTYALFAEQIKFTETTQKALREAVYRGEGLLVAGNQDHRNDNLDEILGIKYRGEKSRAYAVEMSDSDLFGAREIALQLEEKVIIAELKGAASTGYFLFNGKRKDNVHAVTTNQYGDGRAIHVAYDLLAEAALAGMSNPHADLISAALATIAPHFDLPRQGSSVPVMLTLTNKGMATPGQVAITLPQALALIDSGDATQQPDGSLIWPFDLQENEAVALMMWLQPQSAQSDLSIDALIQTGQLPDLLDHATLSLTLMLSTAPSLTDLQQELSQLADQNKAYRKANKYLEKAQQAIDQSDTGRAFENMLKASDKLIKLDTPEAGQIRLKLAEVIRLTGLTLSTEHKQNHDSHDCGHDHDPHQRCGEYDHHDGH